MRAECAGLAHEVSGNVFARESQHILSIYGFNIPFARNTAQA